MLESLLLGHLGPVDGNPLELEASGASVDWASKAGVSRVTRVTGVARVARVAGVASVHRVVRMLAVAGGGDGG